MQSNILLDEVNDDGFEETTAFLLESSSDEEKAVRKHGGSVPGKAPNIGRGRIDGAQRLFDDYFAESPV